PELPLPNALAHWAYSKAGQDNFISKHTGFGGGQTNGEYLVLRLAQNHQTQTESLICSYMLIMPPSPKSPISQFLTIRPKSNGMQRSVRGVIFEAGGMIYSIGKSRYGSGFRTTMLRADSQASGRHHMIGVRLGIQENPDTPFAYPIYCYQLKSQRTKAEKKQLQGRKPPDDEFVSKHISGFPHIIERLRSSAKSGLGCII
ncbi:MAG: hypothetical protein AAF194_01195, partial [Pseudomonadota bacterium]